MFRGIWRCDMWGCWVLMVVKRDGLFTIRQDVV